MSIDVGRPSLKVDNTITWVYILRYKKMKKKVMNTNIHAFPSDLDSGCNQLLQAEGVASCFRQWVWSTALFSHHVGFLSMMECNWKYEANKPFLPLKVFYHSNKKRHENNGTFGKQIWSPEERPNWNPWATLPLDRIQNHWHAVILLMGVKLVHTDWKTVLFLLNLTTHTPLVFHQVPVSSPDVVHQLHGCQ